jgi:hypothetical protein
MLHLHHKGRIHETVHTLHTLHTLRYLAHVDGEREARHSWVIDSEQSE